MMHTETPRQEKMFNIPPLTLAMAVVLSMFFLAEEMIPDFSTSLTALFSFVPQLFSAMPLASSYTLLSYTLLHFGWLHFGMNIFGLLAFGSGVERSFGKTWYAIVFLAGSVSGALGHWGLFPDSLVALGGASAGISALFGAALPTLLDRRNLVGATIMFVLTNIVVGIMGMPGSDGQSIAWQAHLFGFFVGEAIVLFIIKRRRSNPSTPF